MYTLYTLYTVYTLYTLYTVVVQELGRCQQELRAVSQHNLAQLRRLAKVATGDTEYLVYSLLSVYIHSVYWPR